MAKTLKITLKPLEPYFFGGERSFAYGDKLVGQRAKQNPYYITSEKMPAQTALMGVLRYMGIKSPSADFGLTDDDKANIGTATYRIGGSEAQQGRILSLSPLVLEGEGKVLIPAPKNHKPCEKVPCNFQPYDSYVKLENTTRGTCLIPEGYSDKIWDVAQFLAFDPKNPAAKPELVGNLFEERVQVGINRSMQTKDEPGGFFKRQYIQLREPYAFVYYAQVEDDFYLRENDQYVTMGQTKSGFCCTIETCDQPWETLLDYHAALQCLPKQNQKTGKPLYYLYAASDLCFTGNLSALKDHCSFMLAINRNHRSMTTLGGGSMKARYQKHPELLYLIEAGSVFVFESDEQRKEFVRLLEADGKTGHYQVAGYNRVIEI